MIERPLIARKRPVTNEAWQWDGGEESADRIVHWVDENGGFAHKHPYREILVVGEHAVYRGEWIIRDQYNEFYPISDEKFRASYTSNAT